MKLTKRKSSQKAVAAERRHRQGERIRQGGLSARIIAGRVLMVVALLVACLIPVLFVSSPITYIPLVAVVLVLILSYVYLRVLVHSLSYSEGSLLDSCIRGTDIEFVVHFKNRSFLPVVHLEPTFYISDLFGEVDTAIPASMVMMPREERDFRFAASFDHIGTYSAGVSKIVIGDLLGLFQRTVANNERHEVKVMPKIFDIDRMSLDNVSAKESRKAFRSVITDDMDYAGVREYVPGDPLKVIHWKLSASNPTGDYLTRLFEIMCNPGIEIILDSSSPEYDSESLMQVFDGVVESALSISVHSCRVGVDATLIYSDRQGRTCRTHATGVDDAQPLVDAIPRITVGDGRAALDILRREARSIHGEGNLAYCTAQLNEDLVRMLIEVKLHGRNPILFVVVPSSLDTQERREFLRPLHLLEANRVTHYVVSSAEQIDGMVG